MEDGGRLRVIARRKRSKRNERAGEGYVEDTNILSFISAGLPRNTRRWWPPLLGIFEHLSANNKG